MAKKRNESNTATILKQFDEMKAKHPDAVLVFRTGDFYEMFGKDAIQCSEILSLPLHNGVGGVDIERIGFPHHAFEINLPKLVRAGLRVAICEKLEDPKQKKGEVISKESLSNSNDMPKKNNNDAPEQEQAKAKTKSKSKSKAKPDEATQEEPKVKAEKKRSAGTRKSSKAKNDEAKAEKQETKQEEQPVKEAAKVRPPQMITPNGEKVTHAHFFQSRDDVAKWFFTAKIDGVQLHLKVADPADMVFAQQCKAEGKPFPVEELMAKYYPSKVAEKVSEKDFSLPFEITGAKEKVHTVTKLNPYKEKNIDYPDFGKWKLYACIDGKSLSIVPSAQIMSAYFDRSMSMKDIVVGAFGEKLQLPEAYKHLHKPEGLEDGAARIHKVKGDDKNWYISARLGENLSTPSKPISYDDAGSYFSKAVSADQLASKYLSTEIEAGLGKKAAMSNELSNSNSLKI